MRQNKWVILVIGFLLMPLIILSFQACTEKGPSSASTGNNEQGDKKLPASLSRINSTQFDVEIDATELSGFSVSDLQIQVANGTAAGWIQTGSIYTSRITSSVTSGEVKVDVTWKNYSDSKTALMLKTVNSNWDQPESVPGMVNTLGWEDSPEISPDGKLLIVSTYAPVSLICCIAGSTMNAISAGSCPAAGTNSAADNPSCNANFYADNAASRPLFPGASRILSPTAIQHTISLINDTTSAKPPVSSYVFTRQSDGSFARPMPVFIDWEAYTWGAPFGLHFRKLVSANIYKMYLSFSDPILNNGNKIQSVEINFSGQRFVLGKVSLVSGSLVKSAWKMSPLNIPGLTSQTGNPASFVYNGSGDSYVFWDDETLADGQKDLYFAIESSNGTFGSKQTIGLSQGGVDEYQPFFFSDRLYYSLSHLAIVSQELANGSNLASSASWSGFQVELEADFAQIAAAGGIYAIGEPSLYQDAEGKNWLYFAYGVRSASGLNLNIGRVRQK